MAHSAEEEARRMTKPTPDEIKPAVTKTLRPPRVEDIHRAVAEALIETFRPRMDIFAERLDDDDQLARLNKFVKDKGDTRPPFRIGDWKPVRRDRKAVPITVDAIAEHVAGRRTLGFYMLHPDGVSNSISVDFDNHQGARTVDRDPREDLDLLVNVCLRRGVRFLVNVSRGGRGYWLHMLPPVGTQAREGRAVMNALVKESGVKSIADGGTLDCVFPKQDQLVRHDGPTKAPGNLFCLPASARWMTETTGTQFLNTPAGDLGEQLKHMETY
jgi:hypothetical protein